MHQDLSDHTYPLSKGQQAIWFLSQMDAHATDYIISSALEISPRLDEKAIAQTFEYLLQRHEALRLRFMLAGHEPRQFVEKSGQCPISFESAHKLSDRELQQQLRKNSQHPFDLTAELPIRIQVYQREHSSILFIAVHHIVADFWSFTLLIEEIAAVYAAIQKNQPINLPEIKMSFVEHGCATNDWLASTAANSSRAYWQQKLPDVLPILSWPHKAESAQRSGRYQHFILSSKLSSDIIHYAKQLGVTPFTVLLAGYFKFLYLISNQQDIVIGIPTLGRYKSAQKQSFGYYVNSLPIYYQAIGHASFASICQQIHKDVRGAVARQRFPLAEIMRQLDIPRNVNVPPVFQTLFAFQKAQNSQVPEIAALAIDDSRVSIHLSGLEIRAFPFDPGIAQFDLSLTIALVDKQFSGHFQYQTAVFDKEAVLDLIELFEETLGSEISAQEPAVTRLDIGLALSQVAKQQDQQIAIESGDNSLSYTELMQQCQNWQAYFQNSNIKPKDIVAILLPQNEQLMIAVTALLQYGAVLIPLAIDTPEDRLIDYLAQAQCSYLLTLAEIAKHLTLKTPVITLETLQEARQTQHYQLNQDKSGQFNHAQLAACVFTSGSTGKPHCVGLNRGNLLHLAQTLASAYQLTPADQVLQFTSPSFDVFLEEWLTAFYSGAQLIIKPNDLSTDIECFEHFLQQSCISVLNIPFAFWRAWVLQMQPRDEQYLEHLRLVIVGGEPMLATVLKQWHANMPKRITLLNAYGPSEVTVTTHLADVTHITPIDPVPIGLAITGIENCIVNEQFCQVDTGQQGRLYLAGTGVGSGYINESTITNRRFVRLPGHGLKLWFDTGDWVKTNTQGQLFFCGRVDDQVKIAGVRVELNEVAQQIQQYLQVECVVLLVDNELLAFIETETEQELKAAEINEALSKQLLPQMLPKRYVAISVFPVTASGKVDRYALQIYFTKHRQTTKPVFLADASLSTQVQSIIESILKTELDPHQNLFTQGLDSLNAVSCASLLSESFAVKISVRLIFEQATIIGLADAIKQIQAQPKLAEQSAETTTQQHQWPFTPAQKRLQTLQAHTQVTLGKVVAIDMTGSLDTLKASIAWQQAVQSDNVFNLKMLFDQGLQQWIAREAPALHYHDLSELAESKQAKLEEIKSAILNPASQQTLGIEAHLVYLSPDRHQMLIRLSPYHYDFAGLALLLKRFQNLYLGEEISASRNAYLDYSQHCSQLPEIQGEWLSTLSRCITAPQLSIRRQQAKPSLTSCSYTCLLDKQHTTHITNYLRLHLATPSAYFLMIYLVLLDKLSADNQSIGVGSAVSHRHLCPGGLGPLTNFVVLAPDIQANMSFDTALDKVYYCLLQAIDNQHIAMPSILSALGKKGDVLPVECLFLYQSSPEDSFQLDEVGCQIQALNSTEMPALLSLEVIKDEDQYSLQFQYDPQLYTRQSIIMLAETFRWISHQVATQTAGSADDLLMLPERFEQYGQGSKTEWHEDAELLHTCFTTTACLHPFRTAIIANDKKISYGQLYRRSTQISRIIYQQKLKQSQPFVVAILMEKGWEQIAVVLGILRGGGIFAPLNPDLSEEKIKTLLAETNIRWLITSPLLKKLYHWEEDYKVFTLDDPLIRRQNLIPLCKRTIAISPDDPAYILFTSGTTGQPKGVMVSHRAALNTIFDMNHRLAIGSKDTFFALSNLYFDLSIYDIFGAFDLGAKLVLPHHDQRLNVAHWEQLIRLYKVTIWNSVPALYQLLLDSLPTPIESLRHVLLSGDWIPLSLPEKSHQCCPHAQLMSLGGATEVSIWSVSFPIQTVKSDWKSIPYGLPLSNQNCYVLDKNRVICPVDTPGELYIGGAGVALGYFNNASLTQQAFIHHSVSQERLYKTGDSARLSSAGYFEILGRLDSQVKIAGQFVDLALIEHEIQQYSGIQQAAVVAHSQGRHLQVVAFIVSSIALKEIIPPLRCYLSTRVSKVMMPTKIAGLAQLPLSSNGKIDRKQLVAYQGDFFRLTQNGRSPRNATETMLLDIWTSLLSTELSIDDNFFESGGDSLLALSVVGEIKQRLHIDLPVQATLMHQTIAELAQAVIAIQKNQVQHSGSMESALMAGTLPEILSREVFVDKNIHNKSGIKPAGRRQGSRVFLTGATGYLGSRLLLELLSEPETDIFCLLRADDADSARKRLADSLAKLVPLETIDFTRLTPVIGDIAKPLLGLTDVDYYLLAEQMNHIIHCAAQVNFILPRAALKAANIEGTHEILRLATHRHLKSISYVSTISVFPTIANDLEAIFKEDDTLDQGIPIIGGYAQSKWIAENMMQEARRRGIPISIFRPGVIFGDTRLHDLPKDVLLVSFLKLCIKMKAIPDLDIMVDIAPVDYVAKAIISLSQQANKNYHLTNPEPIHIRALVKLFIDIGVEMSSVTASKWFAQAKPILAESTAGSMGALIAMFDDIHQLGAIAFGRNLQHFDCQQSLTDLAGSDISCPAIDAAFLRGFVNALRA